MRNHRKTVFATLVSCGLAAASPFANAASILSDWGVDLTGLNGTAQGGTTYNNMGTLTNLLDLTVSGTSSVEQQLDAGGSPVGQSYSEYGFLDWVGATATGGGTVPPATFGNFLGDNVGGSGLNYIYFEWENLTGTTTNAAGDIVFDTGAAQLGTISLFLDDDASTLASVGAADANRVLLASFDLVPLSGGSGIGVDGGAFPSGTIGLTLDPTSLNNITFLDGDDNPILEEVLLSFVDLDATAANPATFIDDDADGTPDRFIQEPIEHNGSIVVAIPEPGMLALMGLGLAAFAGVRRRKG